MTSLHASHTSAAANAPGASTLSGEAAVLRLLMLTAWLALAVPLAGVIEVAFITGENDFLTPADPAVEVAFAGGAAIGLAIWTLSMRILLRNQWLVPDLHPATLWRLIGAWAPAIGTWLLLRVVASGAVAGGVAVAVLVTGWYMVWRAAVIALR